MSSVPNYMFEVNNLIDQLLQSPFTETHEEIKNALNLCSNLYIQIRKAYSKEQKIIENLLKKKRKQLKKETNTQIKLRKTPTTHRKFISTSKKRNLLKANIRQLALRNKQNKIYVEKQVQRLSDFEKVLKKVSVNIKNAS